MNGQGLTLPATSVNAFETPYVPFPSLTCRECGRTTYGAATECFRCAQAKMAISHASDRRNVYPSNELPHLWAHQAQPSARCKANISFQYGIFYSYREPIGAIVDVPVGPKSPKSPKGKSERVYILAVRKWSITTSQHQGDIRSAIPYGARVFYVHEIRVSMNRVSINHVSIVADFANSIQRLLRESAASREPKKSRLLGEAASLLATAREYAKYFGVRAKDVRLPRVPGTVAELTSAISRADAREKATAKRLEAKRSKTYAAELAEWISGTRDTFSFLPPRSFPVHLRIVGDQVETSQGARFPVSHARRGLALVRSVVARGEMWQRNGHTCHLGHYQIDRITAEGTVYAGCHVVPFASIEAIADQLSDTSTSPDGDTVPKCKMASDLALHP